jgi:hypothetical protein
MNESVHYPKEAIVNLLRDLDVLIVSTDRIGSAWNDRTSEEEYNAMFVKFFHDFGFFTKLANARRVLAAAFDEVVMDDGMDQLEKSMQDLNYWSPGASKT